MNNMRKAHTGMMDVADAPRVRVLVLASEMINDVDLQARRTLKNDFTSGMLCLGATQSSLNTLTGEAASWVTTDILSDEYSGVQK